MADPPSAAEPAAPVVATKSESGQSAAGRRILSTAFVRVGPDDRLTVELRDGRRQLWQGLRMEARSYCGLLLAEQTGERCEPRGVRACGAYDQVVAAQPGDAGLTCGAAPLRLSEAGLGLEPSLELPPIRD